MAYYSVTTIDFVIDGYCCAHILKCLIRKSDVCVVSYMCVADHVASVCRDALGT